MFITLEQEIEFLICIHRPCLLIEIFGLQRFGIGPGVVHNDLNARLKLGVSSLRIVRGSRAFRTACFATASVALNLIRSVVLALMRSGYC